MIVLNLSNIRLVLGARTIFKNLNWRIQHNQVIGLIGPNGAGKSSIFKLIFGEYTHEPGGTITKAKATTIGYLSQEPELPADKSAIQTVLDANPRWGELQSELKRIELELGTSRVYNNPKALARMLDLHERYLEEYQSFGGENFPSRISQILFGLGLNYEEHEKPNKSLSGGQKKLVGLAGLILNKPKVLLLDEPDNHLDIRGKVFLEKLIREYKGAVVIVSHDRYLLDAVVSDITEIEAGSLTTYHGDYSSYVIDKELRLARQEELYKVQQREISRIEAAIKRFAMWGKIYDNEKFAAKAKAFQKRLDRMEKIDRPEIDQKRMRMEISGWRGSTKVLEIAGLEKAFDGQIIFNKLNLQLNHGHRVGLVGPNGSGKSLLFKMILDIDKADDGEIIIGPSITIGYYAQEHETLNPEMSLIDTIRYAAPTDLSMPETKAVAFLNRYLFNYQQAKGKVKNLSGGECSRLQLAMLVLSGANFLLLDEPTNNLDIASAEVLEAELMEFDGTLLVISHDRYFLDQVVDQIIVLKDSQAHNYPGSYGDYLQSIEN